MLLTGKTLYQDSTVCKYTLQKTQVEGACRITKMLMGTSKDQTKAILKSV